MYSKENNLMLKAERESMNNPEYRSKYYNLTYTERKKVDDSIDKDVQKIKSQEDMRKLIIYQFKKSLFGGPLPEDFDHM